MHTLNLQIDDSFYPHFKAIIESFVKDKKVILLKDDNFPKELIVDNADEVKSRSYAAEARIKKGDCYLLD